MNEINQLPTHIGIILDGNRRWAKAKGLAKTIGHASGIRQARKIIKHAGKRGIHVISMYCFSKENWQRPKDEVEYLMNFFDAFIKKHINELHKEGVRLKVLGEMSELPNFLVESLKKGIELTKNNKNMIVQLALNYTGRDEIKRALEKLKEKDVPITEESISDHLDTGGIPDLDMIIRTSGEQRLSGFMLWQAAYAELYFTPVPWPDFTPKEFDKALEEYGNRQRRFGH